MTFANEGTADRAVRMLTGIAVLYVALDGLVAGALAGVVFAAGALALVTGIVGYCPAYTLLGVSTRTGDAPPCVTCGPDGRRLH